MNDPTDHERALALVRKQKELRDELQDTQQRQAREATAVLAESMLAARAIGVTITQLVEATGFSRQGVYHVMANGGDGDPDHSGDEGNS